MTDAIKLIGLDCGSTTTSLIVARARLAHGALGRVEIADLEDVFRSPVVFTPFCGPGHERIDAQRLAGYLDEWLAEALVSGEEVFGGGALVTGLAAEASNAQAIAELVEARLAEAVIATANDPALESWLAFMGNCHALSLARPGVPILNIDIGGGTTNLALGVDGQVVATGALFVGARHLQFIPGTYRLTALSTHGAKFLEALGIPTALNREMSSAEIDQIVNRYIEQIEMVVEGATDDLTPGYLIQLPYQPPRLPASPAVTFSGGVGQLIYERRRGGPPSGVTRFGDLGGELADRIAGSPFWSQCSLGIEPESLGRATAYGLLRHRTELSGATIYLPRPDRLPLKNVPIVARLAAGAADAELSRALALAARCRPAGCLELDIASGKLDEIRALGQRLARAIESSDAGKLQTLVIVVEANLGKVLGSYATCWGRLDRDVMVIDEVPPRDAQFVRLGRMREGVVPLWLYAVR